MTVLKRKRIYFSYFAAISVNMMSMNAGVGFAWSSPSIPKLTSQNPDFNPLPRPASIEEISWITSLHNLGAISGPLFTGMIAEKIGAKKTLIIFSIFQMLSNITLMFANTIHLFYLARFLLGLGTGCVFSLIPVYVAEISEVVHRGRTSMVLSGMITLTQDFVFVVGPYVTIKTLAIISLIFSIFFLATFGIFVPESPYFFVKKDDLKKAEISLIKLRRTTEIKDELLNIVSFVNESENEFSFKALITSTSAVRSFLLSFGLMFFQQFNGINAVSSYQQSIFEASKSSIPADKSVIIVASVQVIAIILGAKLVDFLGRKNLLIYSYLGQFLSLLSLGTYFHLQSNHVDVNFLFWLPLINIMVYMFSFKLGAGPVSWTIAGEIFPPNFKFILSPSIAFVMTVMSFIVTFVFPMLDLEMSFWIFSIVVACAFPFVIFLVPETKAKMFSEIQQTMRGN